MCGKVGQLGKACPFSAAPVGFLNPRFKICGRYVGKEDEGGKRRRKLLSVSFFRLRLCFCAIVAEKLLEKEGAVKMRDFHVRQKKRLRAARVSFDLKVYFKCFFMRQAKKGKKSVTLLINLELSFY